MTLRAAIYARYSSENQRESSIDDQIRLCRDLVAREGWVLAGAYHDAGISGATLLRSGFQALVRDAQSGAFDIVVAEALDRFSRDQEHVAALLKKMRFAGIAIHAVAEGEIGELHVGLKGTMNALFLKDLAQKTHRGLTGRVVAGKSAGGRCYGYDVVRRLDERGEPIRGERAINPAEAAIVQRIFAMFAAGASPIAIAKQLNAEGLPGPSGHAWRDTTIRGHARRGTGILRNELYIGRLVWNRLTYVRDPTTARRVSRVNERGQLIAHDIPELRIIDQELWEAVQARLAGIRAASGADNPDRPRFWENRRAQHVLTGKVFCGCCGGQMSNIGQNSLACAAARKQGTCSSGRGMRRDILEQLVLDALREKLMQPEHVADFVAAFTEEWNRLQAEATAGDAIRRRELEAVTRKLDGLLDAIADGLRTPGLKQKLEELEARKADLERAIQTSPAPAPRLHPGLADVYREKVTGLHAALAGPDATDALEAIRSLIERVVLHPVVQDRRRAFEVELTGEIAAMVRLGMGEQPAVGAATAAAGAGPGLFESSAKVVAGTRNRRSHHSTVPI